MKRPLIAFTLMWTLGIFINIHLNILPNFIYKPWFIVFLFIIVIFIYSLKNKYSSLISVLLTGLMCGILFCNTFNNAYVQPVMDLNNQKHNVTATVIEYPEIYEESQRVIIKVSKNDINNEIKSDINTFVYLPITNKPIIPGDKLEFQICWYIPKVSDGFSRFSYYTGEGVYILGSIEKDASFTVIESKDHPWWYYPKHYAKKMKDSLKKLLNSRQSGFLTAVIFGDTLQLDAIDKSNMRKAGISHVTSVSGLHISFLISFVLIVFGKKFGSVFSLFIIIMFIIMVGWTPSVLRAGFMYFVYIISYWLNRENDSLTALCAALLFVLLTNPYAIDSIGLQLSYLSTLGIILFSSSLQRNILKPFHKFSKKIIIVANFFASSIACSLSAMAFTIPILMYNFGYISVLAPIANLLIIWAVSLIFPFSIVMCIIYPYLSNIAHYMSIIIGYFIDYILFTSKKIADIPFGVVYSENVVIIITIVLFYFTLIAMHIFPKIFKKRYCIPVLSIIIILSTWYSFEDFKNSSRITFLPSGYGQTIVVSSGKELVLIDCSASGTRNGAQNVLDWMNWWGYEKIDSIILTSIDKTHARNIPELIENVKVDKIIIPPNCRQNNFYNEVIASINKKKIPMFIQSNKHESFLEHSNLGISLIGGIDRKLAVKVKSQDDDILILHSFTPKMQNELFKTNDLYADTLVFSPNGISDIEQLKQIIKDIKPKRIIIESSFELASKLFEVPVYNTFEKGEISFKSKLITKSYKEH